MLQRQFRLPASTRLKHPVTYRTSLFMLKVTKTENADSRFGFIVRKAVDKRAVIRNRIRRLFRSCIEDLREQIAPGYDMLFFLEKDIMDKHQGVLKKELESFLQGKKLL